MRTPQRAFWYGAAAGAAITAVGAAMRSLDGVGVAMLGVTIAALIGSWQSISSRLAFLFASGTVAGHAAVVVVVLQGAFVLGLLVTLPFIVPAVLVAWGIGRVVSTKTAAPSDVDALHPRL